MTYKFASALYPTRAAMLRAIAETWLHAEGLNDDAFVAHESVVATTDECIAEWSLARDCCGPYFTEEYLKVELMQAMEIVIEQARCRCGLPEREYCSIAASAARAEVTP
jgi:hypothetical protein